MSKKAKNNVPQGQPQDVIGGGLDPSVTDQIKAREGLLSKPNYNKRSPEQLLFFNANGAWARLVSSINTLTKEETEALSEGTKTIKEVTGNKNLAYNNVIMGGTLKQGTPTQPTKLLGGIDETEHNPINIDNDGFITAGDIKNTAYHKYDSLGFRPVPGIESVSVTSKGTYGSLREAEVNITVWTLEDLEMMQALFLRPGFTILLEWGHSLQLASSTGEINKDIQFYTKFLRNKVPKKTIQDDLKQLTFDSDYNYDAMSGYISNFNWSFREDGGYDCMVKIISTGTVLESIAVTFDTSNVYPAEQMDTWDNDKGKKERRSIYHKLFVELEHLVGDPESSDRMTNISEATTGFNTGVAQLVNGDFSGAGESFSDAGGNIVDAILGDDDKAKERAENIQSATGRKLAADPTFKAKLKIIYEGGVATWKGKPKPWNATDTFMRLEEEEAVLYLNDKFGMYGLTFEETGAGDAMIIKVTNNESINTHIDLDVRVDQTARKHLYDMVDFISENGKLPEDQ